MITANSLSWAVGTNPCLNALRDGHLAAGGVRLEQVPVPNIVAAFRRMCRTLEFEVSEMSVVTYFAARQYGIPMTAIPVFPLTRFLHDTIYYNINAGIRSPKDLEGKRVGERSYTLTPGVWAKSILAEEHGVDLNAITWVVSDEEHVLQCHDDTPANVIRDLGADLPKQLAAGDPAAGLSVRSDSPNVRPLIPGAAAAAIESYRKTGVRPIDHLMVVRNDVLEEKPWFAEALFEACKASKAEWRRTPASAGLTEPHNDPMPCGLSESRLALEKLMRLSVEQKVLKQPLDLNEIFPGNLN